MPPRKPITPSNTYEAAESMPVITMSADLGKHITDLGSIEVDAPSIRRRLMLRGLDDDEIGSTTIHIAPSDDGQQEVSSQYLGDGRIEIKLPELTAWTTVQYDIPYLLVRDLERCALDRPFGTLEQEIKEYNTAYDYGRLYRFAGLTAFTLNTVTAIGEVSGVHAEYATPGIGAAAVALYMAGRKKAACIREARNHIHRIIAHRQEGLSLHWVQVLSSVALQHKTEDNR